MSQLKDDGLIDYQFGWRWLLPNFRDKSVVCEGLRNDEQQWWVMAHKIRLTGVSKKKADGYLISLDFVEPESVGNSISRRSPNWVCAWGTGQAVNQLRSQLAGYSTIREYALLPANNPRVVVPLSSPRAAIAGLRLHRPGRLIARVALLVARVCAHFGNYSLLRQRVLLIATMEKNAVPHGESRLALDGYSDFALYLGTPDFNRKTVVLPLRESPAALILKVAETIGSRAALEREAQALRLMSHTLLADKVPKLLGLKELGDRLTLAQEFRQRETVSHARMRFAVVNFLAQLSMVERRQVALADWLLVTIQQGSNTDLSGEVLDASRRLRSRLEALANEGKQILLHRTHGDFAPWNCAWTAQGLFVYDWEESSNHGLALGDAFYFVLSPFLHVQKTPDAGKALTIAMEFASDVAIRSGLCIGTDIHCETEVRMYLALWLLGRLNQSPFYGELAVRLERSWT